MAKNLDKYLDSVRAKLKDPTTKQMLMFGQMDPKIAKPFRTDAGYKSTCENIMNAAETLHRVSIGKDAVTAQIANFAEMPGYGDVQGVTTVGAIDVSIFCYANSVIPYVAVDRGMSTPTDTVYYRNLIARNSAGGVNAGDKVLGNFNPPNTKVRLGLVNLPAVTGSSDGGKVVANLQKNIIPGQVTVNVVATDGSTYVGKDFSGDGNVYFEALPSGCGPFKVDYQAKTVSTVNLAGGYTMQVSAIVDSTKDSDGSNILRVSQDWPHISLTAEPKQIILDQNLITNAYINKTHKFSGGSSAKDYADLAFNSITDVYIEAINMEVLSTITGIYDPVAFATINSTAKVYDLSSYDVSKFAETKNDTVSQFMITLKAAFIGRTTMQPTVILTGTNGTGLLEGCKDKWVPNPEALKGLNGLAGYFDGVPVYRHNFFDDPEITPVGQADFYLCSKMPDNSVGSAIFGEYLPLTNSGNVNNFLNPIQVANGFFSMVGNKLIDNSLVQKGSVMLPAVMRAF